jgi:hypothetical protein
MFSGENFEDMIASLTYPYTLPPGWSVEWEGSSASADASPSEWCLVWALSRCHVIISYRAFTFRWINELWWTVVDKTSVVLLSLLSERVCNNFKFHYKTLWCMKCVWLYSLDSPSCKICLFDPGFRGFNRDFTRGTAEVRASWIRVAFATMVSALIQFILGGSATFAAT